MNYCPNCGADVEEQDKFCFSCGAPLEPNKVKITAEEKQQPQQKPLETPHVQTDKQKQTQEGKRVSLRSYQRDHTEPAAMQKPVAHPEPQPHVQKSSVQQAAKELPMVEDMDFLDKLIYRLQHVPTKPRPAVIGPVWDWTRNIMGGLLAITGVAMSATEDFNTNFTLGMFFLSTMAIWYRLLWKGRTNAVVEGAVPAVMFVVVMIALALEG